MNGLGDRALPKFEVTKTARRAQKFFVSSLSLTLSRSRDSPAHSLNPSTRGAHTNGHLSLSELSLHALLPTSPPPPSSTA